MSQKEIAQIKKLAKEAEKAARVVTRNRFLIETYMSLADAKAKKGQSHTSVRALFHKLSI